jgi:chitinase
VVVAALPAKVLACYYTTWDTSRYALTDVPTDFNLIYLFHSKPLGTPVDGSYNNVADGSFYFEHYSTVTATQVQACRLRGQRVILTVGGASAGYAWDTRTKSRNFVASFHGMYARLGRVDGVDFNNYEATILNTSNLAAVTADMVWITQQLRALYGADFAITSPPQPNDPNQQSLMAGLARAGVLNWAGPQFYDWTGFNASGYIAGRINTWVDLVGGDASRTVVGLSANYSNGPSLDDCVREWNAVKAAHPAIRGMFCWSAQTNLAGGHGWGSAMKTLL